MGEARCELADGGARAAADIEDGDELAAGGGVVVDDGLVQVRVVAVAALGVGFALFVGVGAKGLFWCCWSGCWICHSFGFCSPAS